MSPPLPEALAPPVAPGTLDDIPEPHAILEFLGAMRVWRDGIDELLDVLQERFDDSDTGELADLTLARALGKTIDDRLAEITTVWDSGRVGVTERGRIADLVWGRLDVTTTARLAVNLPEATTLQHVLVGELRARLDGADRISWRHDMLVDRARALGAERDEVARLVARCREKFTPPPDIRLPLPSDFAADGDPAICSRNLEAAANSLRAARAACDSLLDRRAELRGLAEAYRDMAAERGAAEEPRVVRLWATLRLRLWSAPCDLDAAAAELADFQALVRIARPAPRVPAAGRDTGPRT